MGLQLTLIAAAFFIFGIIAWIAQGYSPAYIGLIVFGILGVFLGIFVMRSERRVARRGGE